MKSISDVLKSVNAPPQKRRIAMQTFDEFVRPLLPVNPTDELTRSQAKIVRKHTADLLNCKRLMETQPELARHLEDMSTPVPISWYIMSRHLCEILEDALGASSHKRRSLAPRTPVIGIEKEDGETHLAAGIVEGVPIVREDLRGKGLGTAMHLLCDRHGIFPFSPSGYSRQGYQSRVAAHREACRIAAETGQPVAPENVTRYSLNVKVF